MFAKNATRSEAITIFVPGLLRDRCEGAAKLSVTASNVRAALDEVETKHPALYQCVCNETGAVRKHINLFVNALNIRDLDGLESALAPGDLLTILPAVSGG